MSKKWSILSILVVFFFTSLGWAKEKTIIRSVSKQDMLMLKKVDRKYQKNHGIHLKLKKEITLGMLGTKKSSKGEVWLSGGQMRLEMHSPDPSKIIADNKFLWIESAPPEGFENSKVQVLRASLNSEQAKSQGLIQLLTKGGILKYFRVSGIKKRKKEITYFLQPDKQSIEFKRAQIVVDVETLQIKVLRYWDQLDNETTYSFTRSDFNKKFDQKLFTYKPPKNSELIIY